MSKRAFPGILIVWIVTFFCLAGIAWAAEKPSTKQATTDATTEKPYIIIDADKTGEPISKYVYGQFIEHLGRCIYGGIWAEMLEDRKFFFSVGDKESPWKILGDGKVEMNREEPFVGTHSPQITTTSCDVEAGLLQAGLALRNGKKYVGRIWLAAPPKLQHAGPIQVSLVWGPSPKQRQTLTFHQDCREIASLRGKGIRIALDEWNYWYGPHVFGELGTRYFLKDGLGIAAGIHEMARQSDVIYMANYAQTVNVIGCIKTSKTAAEFETTGLVLKLYRAHFGVLPAATRCDRSIDSQAAWSADRKSLTIAVMNPSPNAIEAPLIIKGAKLTGAGTCWKIAGTDPMAYNDPGKPPRLTIVESIIQGLSDKLALVPYSVTLFAFDVK